MQSPLVSIIVTTRNEEKNIENCLISVQEQTHPHLEIIVVDNNSTDRTKEIARKFTDKVFDHGPERSAQRNFGVFEIAQGQYVLYLDADMIIPPPLVATCAKYISENTYLALHISEIVLGKKFFSRVRRFERQFYDGTCIDGARFFQREAFIQVKGFDESLNGPEDWDIDKKIKQIGSIGLLPIQSETAASTTTTWSLQSFIHERGLTSSPTNPCAIFHNEAEFHLKTYLRKKRYYLSNFNIYIAKWGSCDPDLSKQIGIYYRLLGVFLENGKWKRLLSNPHYTFGLYILRFLVAFQYLIVRTCSPPSKIDLLR